MLHTALTSGEGTAEPIHSRYCTKHQECCVEHDWAYHKRNEFCGDCQAAQEAEAAAQQEQEAEEQPENVCLPVFIFNLPLSDVATRASAN